MKDKKIHSYINSVVTSIDEIKSKKRIAFVSNRINKLENDIKEIKSKNLSMIIPEDKFMVNTSIIKKDRNNIKSKYIKTLKHMIKPYSISNDYRTNITFGKSKIKMKKPINIKKKIFKKNNRYNDSINEKKNILLNISSQLIKSIQKKNQIEQSTSADNKKKGLTNNNNPKKIRQIFPLNEQHEVNIEKKNGNEKNINGSNINNMRELDYEFEIRLLKKKLILLKNENKEKKEKLDNIKNMNKNIENVLDKRNILNNLILLFKNYIIYNNKNRLNYDINENKYNNNNVSIDALILIIMDLKYDYENNILIDEFLEGINKLFMTQLQLINNNDNNLIQRISSLIETNKDLNNDINKYKYSLKEDIKYFYYFKSLLNNLNLNNFTDLEKFLNKIYMENIQENYQMKKLKKTLMKNSTYSKTKKDKKQLYYSSFDINRFENNFDKNNTEIKNIKKIKKSDIKIKQNKTNPYIPNKRNNDDLNEKIINRTEQINKYNTNYLIKFNNMDENGQNLFCKKDKTKTNLSYYTLNNPNYQSKHKKKIKKKINLNRFFNNKNTRFNEIRNISNKFNINNLFNDEEDMNDIKYHENNPKNTKNKELFNNNNINKNFYGHVKNHSVIIFNK